VLKDARGPSPQTVGRVVRRVADAMFELKNEVIKWPNDKDQMVSDFYDIAGFPSVAGCIDGTHVKVIPPAEDEFSFLNRHHEHSINVCAVCGPGTYLQNSYIYLWTN